MNSDGMKLVKRVFKLLARLQLWLAVKLVGRWRIPLLIRRRLIFEERSFREWVQQEFGGSDWRTQTLSDTVVQPFHDLFNGPAGGDAYCGGVIFSDIKAQPELRHFRGRRAIDRPLAELASGQPQPVYLEGRQFWCGPLAFHFGHQIADFGSRVLLASVDPRGGELLWCPWLAGSTWDDLKPWQQFLLTYLNPGGKHHRIADAPVLARELIVVPQQARMRSAPTLAHLEALNWCESTLNRRSSGVVYVSRALFAPCRDAATLVGAYAGEALFERILQEKGVTVIHPESLSLREQLEIYLGASALIVAEGSAQHALELLGVHCRKSVVIICRRDQLQGMELPLKARFPRVQFIQAFRSQWQANNEVAWNGLALLDWISVVSAINPLLEASLTQGDCRELQKASEDQFRQLAANVSLKLIDRHD